jgi:hypothetical protein
MSEEVKFTPVYPTDEFLGALFMCLQKSLFEGKDIREILSDLQFVVSEGMLFVMNPPVYEVSNESLGIESGEEE